MSVCEFVCVFFFCIISVACSEKLHSKYSKQRRRGDEGSIGRDKEMGEMDHALMTGNDAKKGGKFAAQSLVKIYAPMRCSAAFAFFIAYFCAYKK